MNILINLLVAIVVFWVIYTYLIPMLPAPLNTVALILVVLVAVVYLLRLIA